MFLVVNFKKINGSTTFFPKNQWSHVQLQKISMCLVIISKNIDVPSGDGYVDFKKSMYLVGTGTLISNKSMYLVGTGTLISNKSMYLVGTGTLISKKSMYLVGTGTLISKNIDVPGGDRYVDFKQIDVPGGDRYVDFENIDVPGGDRYVDFKKIDVPGEVGYVDFSTSMYLVGLGTLIPREWQSVPTLWVWMLETAYILTRAYAKPMGYIDFQDKSQETDQCISLGLIH